MTYSIIIPKEILERHELEAAKLAAQLKRFSGTWVDKSPLLRELIMWHYERKFLKSLKKVTDAFKHS